MSLCIVLFLAVTASLFCRLFGPVQCNACHAVCACVLKSPAYFLRALTDIAFGCLVRWETGYWGTMDIMHDRAGYYICWGCLVWVPSVYTSPALFLTQVPLTFKP